MSPGVTGCHRESLSVTGCHRVSVGSYLQLDGQPGVLDLHPLHLDAPGLGGHVQHPPHPHRDRLPVAQEFVQILGSEDVGEDGLGEEGGGVVGVLHGGLAECGVADPVVDHRVHGYCHRVPRQHLVQMEEMEDGGWQTLNLLGLKVSPTS